MSRSEFVFGLCCVSFLSLGCSLMGEDYRVVGSVAPDGSLEAGADADVDASVDAGGQDADAMASGDAGEDASPPDATPDAAPCTPTDPPTEVCDGIDNDCNPETEDGSQEAGFGLACDGPDEDICEEGVRACEGGPGLVCTDRSGDTDFRSDEDNCGSCGIRCMEAEVCGDSVCAVLPVAVGAGLGHSCALMSNRRVYCWGNNANGELGVGMSTSRSLTPVQVQGLTGAVSISVGQTHSCAVTSSGAVFCWGDGVNGALGTGSMDDAFGAVEVTALASTAVQVAAGQANTCAVLMDGTIQCWGQGTNGVLGDGTMALRSVPGAVSGIDNAVNVDVGVDSACAVLSTGRVKCWGGNGFRKLGQDSPAASSSVPLEIRSDWISTAQQVEVGQNHACARTSTRTLVCWGSSADGRLGRSTLESFGLPDMATPTSEVVEISLLLDFAALRERSTGNIRLWGAGLGGGEASVLATVDAFPGQAISLGVGVAHVCGVNDSHRVYCWGRNSSGQLGDGTLTEQLAPGLRRAVSFSL